MIDPAKLVIQPAACRDQRIQMGQRLILEEICS